MINPDVGPELIIEAAHAKWFAAHAWQGIDAVIMSPYPMESILQCDDALVPMRHVHGLDDAAAAIRSACTDEKRIVVVDGADYARVYGWLEQGDLTSQHIGQLQSTASARVDQYYQLERAFRIRLLNHRN